MPGEYRSPLRRIIVTQGDTEPASVEQQRMLGMSCPSLYDLRNIYQVNVEEGRHLWAMVYLLHRYFGRDGREEAEALLERRSGDEDNPRILGAFNEPTPDWLAFYMFTFFTDRDGKFQLSSLAESGFDPLARTCRFMLTEEAHHMFVGETGVGRIVQRTAEVMAATQGRRSRPRPRPRRHRPADDSALSQLPLQRDAGPVRVRRVIERRHLLHLRAQRPLRRNEDRGRSRARRRDICRRRSGGRASSSTARSPALSALNERLRDDYIAEVQAGVDRWNRHIDRAGPAIQTAAAAQGIPSRHRELRRPLHQSRAAR